jgi:aspartate kinase
MNTLVMKFGGLALGTTTALTQVLSIILHEREQWDRLLIVVSALEGVTDSLLEATRQAQISNRRGYRRITATLRTRHFALVEHLPLDNTERQAIQADIDRLLFEMLDQLQNIADATPEELAPATVDTIIGTGERLAARILAAMLRQNNVRAVAIDSHGLIITDDNFGNATPNIERSGERIRANLLPMLDRRIVPVITGFIGSTPDGRTTTMGRGGTDYTASVVANCAGADEMWVWTNVDGMMTTDPNEIDGAQVIPSMSYREVGEMAYFGARVLHPHMIRPLQAAHIPLYIKNVFKPGQPGTLVSGTKPNHKHIPKAVTTIQGISLTTEKSGSLANITALVNDVLEQTAGSPAEVMIASQSSSHSFLCFIIPTSSGPGAVHIALDTLRRRIEEQPQFAAWTVKIVSVLTVISTAINTTPNVAAHVLEQLGSTPLLTVAYGPSNCSFSVVVSPNHANSSLMRIHDYILKAANTD